MDRFDAPPITEIGRTADLPLPMSERRLLLRADVRDRAGVRQNLGRLLPSRRSPIEGQLSHLSYPKAVGQESTH